MSRDVPEEGTVQRPMRRWLDPDWYRYLHWRLGPDGRLALGVFLLAVLGLGGFFSLRALPGSGPPASQPYAPPPTPVAKPARGKEHGPVVVKRGPGVHPGHA